MNRALVTLCVLSMALTGPLIAAGSDQELESRIGLSDPLRASGTFS